MLAETACTGAGAVRGANDAPATTVGQLNDRVKGTEVALAQGAAGESTDSIRLETSSDGCLSTVIAETLGDSLASKSELERSQRACY